VHVNALRFNSHESAAPTTSSLTSLLYISLRPLSIHLHTSTFPYYSLWCPVKTGTEKIWVIMSSSTLSSASLKTCSINLRKWCGFRAPQII
jgi:hypothetical protein